jgi:hypothetical protein
LNVRANNLSSIFIQKKARARERGLSFGACFGNLQLTNHFKKKSNIAPAFFVIFPAELDKETIR